MGDVSQLTPAAEGCSASARGPVVGDMSDPTNGGVQIAAEGGRMAVVTVAFDTLKAATRLQEDAGFDQTKARVLVSSFAAAAAMLVAVDKLL